MGSFFSSRGELLSERPQPIGILGGMFDPIHFGHLRCALELVEELSLHEVRLLPCARPPHRPMPGIAAKDRLAMVRRAIDGESCLIADDRELKRFEPSYTVDTLKSLRIELPRTPLCLIVGVDAFHGFPSWHRWRDLFELSHVVVLQRPRYEPSLSNELAEAIQSRVVSNPKELRENQGGGVMFTSVTQLEISSTDIRRRLSEGKRIRYLVPDSVIDFIRERGLYRS